MFGLLAPPIPQTVHAEPRLVVEARSMLFSSPQPEPLLVPIVAATATWSSEPTAIPKGAPIPSASLFAATLFTVQVPAAPVVEEASHTCILLLKLLFLAPL